MTEYNLAQVLLSFMNLAQNTQHLFLIVHVFVYYSWLCMACFRVLFLIVYGMFSCIIPDCVWHVFVYYSWLCMTCFRVLFLIVYDMFSCVIPDCACFRVLFLIVYGMFSCIIPDCVWHVFVYYSWLCMTCFCVLFLIVYDMFSCIISDCVWHVFVYYSWLCMACFRVLFLIVYDMFSCIIPDCVWRVFVYSRTRMPPVLGGSPHCPQCSKPVYFAEEMRLLGKKFHKLCVKCSKKNQSIDSSDIKQLKRLILFLCIFIKYFILVFEAIYL